MDDNFIVMLIYTGNETDKAQVKRAEKMLAPISADGQAILIRVLFRIQDHDTHRLLLHLMGSMVCDECNYLGRYLGCDSFFCSQ